MKKLFGLLMVPSLLCAFALGQAQEKVLWSFAGYPTDGAQPADKLILDSAGNLYGTTQWGGTNANIYCTGCGTVFELSPGSNGSWTETVLYNFCQSFDGNVCLDGAAPSAGLIFDQAGNLYGTTRAGGGDLCGGGNGGCGTVFELSPPNVSGGSRTYAVLYQFCQTDGGVCPDGADPYGKLTTDSRGNLYGTTASGGTQAQGVVFELSKGSGGWTESVLYSFCVEGNWPVCPDGASPMAGITFDKAGDIYGTTEFGGSNQYRGGGVVYKLTNDGRGWSEAVLKAFGSENGPKGGTLLGAVNFDPVGNLYSTALQGGPSNAGVVFRLSAKGYAEQFLPFNGTNGGAPMAGVLIDQSNDNIYGTTSGGQGESVNGTVYRIAGGKQSVIWAFGGVGGGDGAKPEGALITAHGNLYGTTSEGGILNPDCGSNGCGTVFEISK